MRTDPPHLSEPPSPQARLRRRIGPVLRWMAVRGGLTRWSIAFGALALVLAAASYFAVSGTDTDAWEPLCDDHKLTASEIDRIVAALAAAKIPYGVDNKRIVIVPASRKNEARVSLVKQKANPRTLQDVLDETRTASSWIDGQAERDQKHHRLREEALELMIRDQPGVESASVMISRPRTRGASTRVEHPTAIVYIRAEGGGSISPATVEIIRNLVRATEREVLVDGITVQDALGHTYCVAGNPSHGALAQARVQEEIYQDKIKERLRDIDGVKVFVTLDAPLAESPTHPAKELGVNTPLGESSPVAAPKPTVAGKAMVLVQVPISYYLERYKALAKANHEPAPEDLQPYVEKTEEVIRNAVSNAIPAAELGLVKISRIDVPSLAHLSPANSATASENRRVSLWWLGASGGGAIVLVGLLAIGGRWLVARRPPTGFTRPHPRPSFKFDTTGPSERVRELVRRDPEGAAGVLQRWIGGEGDVA
jgi:hypothetical protein